MDKVWGCGEKKNYFFFSDFVFYLFCFVLFILILIFF